MNYTFLCVERGNFHAQSATKPIPIQIYAPNADEARWALPAIYRPLFAHPIAILPDNTAKADYCAREIVWAKFNQNSPARFSTQTANAKATTQGGVYA